MSDFDQAFAIVIGVEGGYVDDKYGGPTKYGISARAYPKLDIENLTLEQAKEIYQTDYWNKAHCGDMAWPFCCCVFDCAVNQGVSQSKLLSAQLISSAAESPAVFMAHRAIAYMTDRGFAEDGLGWLKRLFIVAMKSAVDNPPPPVVEHV